MNSILIAVIGILVVTALSLWITAPVTVSQSVPPEIERGTNFERVCYREQGKKICTQTIFQYDKFFNNGTDWIEINESLFACGTEVCSPHYYYNVTFAQDGWVSLGKQSNKLKMKLEKILDQELTPNLSFHNSIAIYEMKPNMIYLRYQYFARQLKEDIILKTQPPLPPKDFDIMFLKQGGINETYPSPVLCDSASVCIEANITQNDSAVWITVPVDWLKSNDRVYPVYVDPTTSLDSTNTWWNGYITASASGISTGYDRINNPAMLLLSGRNLPLGASTAKNNSAAIEFNLSTIPDNANIINATLVLYFNDTKGAATNTISFHPVTKMNGEYPDTTTHCLGNCMFKFDMENETIYNSTKVTGFIGRQVAFNLSFGAVEAIAAAITTTNNFSIGWNSSLTLNTNLSIGSKDAVNTTWRPYLNITYTIGTCSYRGSGDYVINCADNCLITDTVDLNNNNFVLYGTGTTRVNTDITKINQVIKANTCILVKQNGVKVG